MQKIVLASNNAGKVREFSQLLANTKVQIVPQSDYKVASVAETGLSFVENALIKARHAAEQTQLPAFADDSGLEVEALQGAPGIYSARFAGEKASDADNVKLLLEKLQGHTVRSACFRCVIVYLRHACDPMPLICSGTWEGVITEQPVGDKGFGYDPVFFVPSQQRTAAQLEPAIKNQLSHRGQAMRALQAAWVGSLRG